jgi:hypothetical protein
MASITRLGHQFRDLAVADRGSKQVYRSLAFVKILLALLMQTALAIAHNVCFGIAEGAGVRARTTEGNQKTHHLRLAL